MIIRWCLNTLLSLLLFSFAMSVSFASASSAQPILTNNQAIRIIDSALKIQPLFWQGFSVPYSIERASRHPDASMLEVLFNHGLLTRSKETKVVEIANSNRKRIALNYRYDFRDQQTGALFQSQGGFYYGHGRLKNILKLSKPYLIDGDYYAEAYIQWYVADLQDWVDAPAFDTERLLRRSLESTQKPFEKRVFLQHNGDSWGFWKGSPAAL